MSDSVRPHRRQTTRLPRPWDSPGKNTGVGCYFPLQCIKVKSESEVAQCVRLLATPWTAAYQAPPSMGFCRQEYWSGVPLPSLLTNFKISSKILNLLSLNIVTSQPIPQTDAFYIDGTKNTKASFWSLKKYKVFYTKFHSAQQNELYALIQVSHLHAYPINIVSDSLYSVFVLKNIKASIINSNQSVIQQLFLNLQSIVKNCTFPIYITHIRTHSCLPGPMAHDNK